MIELQRRDVVRLCRFAPRPLRARAPSACANASPTIAICVTFSRCDRRATARAASKCRPSSVTIAPPSEHRLERRERAGAVHQRRRGQVHAVSRRRRRSRSRSRRRLRPALRAASRRRAGTVARREHAAQVLVAPHHALRHAGGAAGVEEVEVVARAFDARHRLVRGEEVLVARPRSPGAARRRRPAIHSLHVRRAVADLGDAVAEAAVEEQRLGVGVVEQVDELVLEVAVVHVDRDAAHLERREHDLRCTRCRCRGTTRPWSPARGPRRRRPAARRAARSSNSRHVARAVALHERDAIGQRVGDRLPHRREVPVHGGVPPSR